MNISTEKEILMTEINSLCEAIAIGLQKNNRDYNQEKILKKILKSLIRNKNESVIDKLNLINAKLKKDNSFIIDDFTKEVIQIKKTKKSIKILFCVPLIFIGISLKKNSDDKYKIFQNELGKDKNNIENIFKKMIGMESEINIIDHLIDHDTFIGGRKKLLDYLESEDNYSELASYEQHEHPIGYADDGTPLKTDVIKYITGSISVNEDKYEQEKLIERISDFSKYSKELIDLCNNLVDIQNLALEKCIVLAPSLITTALENGRRRFNYEINFLEISNILNSLKSYSSDINAKVIVETTQGFIEISLINEHGEVFSNRLNYPIKSYEEEILDLKAIFDVLKTEVKFKIIGTK